MYFHLQRSELQGCLLRAFSSMPLLCACRTCTHFHQWTLLNSYRTWIESILYVVTLSASELMAGSSTRLAPFLHTSFPEVVSRRSAWTYRGRNWSSWASTRSLQSLHRAQLVWRIFKGKLPDISACYAFWQHSCRWVVRRAPKHWQLSKLQCLGFLFEGISRSSLSWDAWFCLMWSCD